MTSVTPLFNFIQKNLLKIIILTTGIKEIGFDGALDHLSTRKTGYR